MPGAVVLQRDISTVCISVPSQYTSVLQVKYDKDAVQVDPLQPAFTRRREVFIGRLAMVGFVSAILGEVSP